jgi:phage terminase large subunit-like protein
LPSATHSNPWPPRWLTPVPKKQIEAGQGNLVIEFAENFGIITKDSVAGKMGEQMVLRDWQQDLVRHMFAHEEGGLRHRVQLIGMPRKSGKSALGSVLSLYSLMLGPQGGEVYSVAAEKEQARIVFKDAKRMIEASQQLSGMANVYRDAIEIPSSGSVYRALSAEAYSKEGLNPHFVMFDELHAQPNRELFDVMSLSMGSRGRLATLVAITTAGVKADNTGHDSIAYSLYQYGQKISTAEVDDTSYFMAWWEDDGDHRDPETWKKANPGYGDISDPEDFVSAVRRTPEAEFRTKRCNQWVSSATAWLPTGAWDKCESQFSISQDDEIILGFDGSFSGDASVIVGATIPKTEDEKVRIFLVRSWEKDLVEGDPNWRVDISEVEDEIVKFCANHPNVREIACDPFRWQRSMQVLEDRGLPVVEWPSTSAARMVKACAIFYDGVVEERFLHDGDPVLSRHLDNAVTKVDNLGPRIVKEKRNSPRKIDAAVAAVIAVDRALAGRMDAVVPQFFS